MGVGGFLVLMRLKKGGWRGVLLGVVCGLTWDKRPAELLSDLEDSEALPFIGGNTGPSVTGLALVDGCGEPGSSKVDRDGRVDPSLRDLLVPLLGSRPRLGALGASLDRCSMKARLLREALCFGP